MYLGPPAAFPPSRELTPITDDYFDTLFDAGQSVAPAGSTVAADSAPLQTSEVISISSSPVNAGSPVPGTAIVLSEASASPASENNAVAVDVLGFNPENDVRYKHALVLAGTLKKRLTYAYYKVKNGWQNEPFENVKKWTDDKYEKLSPHDKEKAAALAKKKLSLFVESDKLSFGKGSVMGTAMVGSLGIEQAMSSNESSPSSDKVEPEGLKRGRKPRKLSTEEFSPGRNPAGMRKKAKVSGNDEVLLSALEDVKSAVSASPKPSSGVMNNGRPTPSSSTTTTKMDFKVPSHGTTYPASAAPPKTASGSSAPGARPPPPQGYQHISSLSRPPPNYPAYGPYPGGPPRPYNPNIPSSSQPGLPRPYPSRPPAPGSMASYLPSQQGQYSSRPPSSAYPSGYSPSGPYPPSTAPPSGYPPSSGRLPYPGSQAPRPMYPQSSSSPYGQYPPPSSGQAPYRPSDPSRPPPPTSNSTWGTLPSPQMTSRPMYSYPHYDSNGRMAYGDGPSSTAPRTYSGSAGGAPPPPPSTSSPYYDPRNPPPAYGSSYPPPSSGLPYPMPSRPL